MSVAEGRLWVRLTRACNQRCLFCLDRDAQNGTMRPEAEILRKLAGGRRRGLTRVVLSGGEPTIHPKFLAVVARARDLGYTHVQTISNGRRFCYPSFARSAFDAGLREATFSLHGRDAATHDALTRTPGSFAQAVMGLRHALAVSGLIVSVDVVINRLNLPQLREHLDFCWSLGAREFDLMALVPFGDAWRDFEALACDFSRPDNAAHLRRALEVSRRPGAHIWTNRLRAEHLEGYESLIQPPEKILDEVCGGRVRLFSAWMRSGTRMPCAGPACAHCFLRGFCADLGELLSSGGISDPGDPPCLPVAAARGVALRLRDVHDVAAFARYYISRRYRTKSAVCGGCADFSACSGPLVSDVRERGYSICRPRAGVV